MRSFDLAIGKALAEECVLALEERTIPNRREQLGERIQREIQPGGSLETPCVRRTDATGNRGDVFIDEAIGLDSGSREPLQFEFAELAAPEEERAEQPGERRASRRCCPRTSLRNWSRAA